MKKKLFYSAIFTIIVLFFTSCEKTEKEFDASLLTGKWVAGSEYYKYNSNGTGSMWDTNDDTSEFEPSSSFSWTLNGDQLMLYHTMSINDASIPKEYTLTELTVSNLRYEDKFNHSYSFSKVQ